jgi:6-phosphofructokinase
MSAPPKARLATITAVMVATEAIDRLQPTAASHDRVMILEVMGHDRSQIALAAGIAGGADVILVPEIPYNIGVVAAHISKLRHGTHNFAIVVVAEGFATTLANTCGASMHWVLPPMAASAMYSARRSPG